MKCSLGKQDFEAYLDKLLIHAFPDGSSNPGLERCFEVGFSKIEYCMRHIQLPHFQKDGEAYLNHLNSDQMAMVVAILANTAYFDLSNTELASKFFYLNKQLHGFHCMYDTKLPKVFLIIHAVGTILGKAEYDDFFVCCHGCTVGSNNGKSPKFGKGVIFFPHSAVIGDCHIGNNVTLSYGTTILDANIESDSIVSADKSFIVKEKKSLSRLNGYFKGYEP